MSFSFTAKVAVLSLFVGSILYVHLRGKARLPVLRQFVNHSALFAPYNALMYLFSGCLLYTSDAAGYSLCRSRWSPYH